MFYKNLSGLKDILNLSGLKNILIGILINLKIWFIFLIQVKINSKFEIIEFLSCFLCFSCANFMLNNVWSLCISVTVYPHWALIYWRATDMEFLHHIFEKRMSKYVHHDGNKFQTVCRFWIIMGIPTICAK